MRRKKVFSKFYYCAVHEGGGKRHYWDRDVWQKMELGEQKSTGNGPLFVDANFNRLTAELNLFRTEMGNNRPWLRELSYTFGFNRRLKCTAGISRKKRLKSRQRTSFSATPVIIRKLSWHSAIICFVMTENSRGYGFPGCYVIKNWACEKHSFCICKQQGEPLHQTLPIFLLDGGPLGLIPRFYFPSFPPGHTKSITVYCYNVSCLLICLPKIPQHTLPFLLGLHVRALLTLTDLPLWTSHSWCKARIASTTNYARLPNHKKVCACVCVCFRL